jgi:hypothetical protein
VAYSVTICNYFRGGPAEPVVDHEDCGDKLSEPMVVQSEGPEELSPSPCVSAEQGVVKADSPGDIDSLDLDSGGPVSPAKQLVVLPGQSLLKSNLIGKLGIYRRETKSAPTVEKANQFFSNLLGADRFAGLRSPGGSLVCDLATSPVEDVASLASHTDLATSPVKDVASLASHTVGPPAGTSGLGASNDSGEKLVGMLSVFTDCVPSPVVVSDEEDKDMDVGGVQRRTDSETTESYEMTGAAEGATESEMCVEAQPTKGPVGGPTIPDMGAILTTLEVALAAAPSGNQDGGPGESGESAMVVGEGEVLRESPPTEQAMDDLPAEGLVID